MSTAYGKCKTCGVELETEDDANKHMAATSAPVYDEPGVTSRSHTVSILNPSRENVVRRRIHGMLDDWIAEAVEKLAELVDDGGYTEAEIRDALYGHYPEFADAWNGRAS